MGSRTTLFLRESCLPGLRPPRTAPTAVSQGATGWNRAPLDPRRCHGPGGHDDVPVELEHVWSSASPVESTATTVTVTSSGSGCDLSSATQHVRARSRSRSSTAAAMSRVLPLLRRMGRPSWARFEDITWHDLRPVGRRHRRYLRRRRKRPRRTAGIRVDFPVSDGPWSDPTADPAAAR